MNRLRPRNWSRVAGSRLSVPTLHTPQAESGAYSQLIVLSLQPIFPPGRFDMVSPYWADAHKV